LKKGIAFSLKQYPVIEFIWLEKNKLPELFQQQLSNLGLNKVSAPFKIEQDWLITRVSLEYCLASSENEVPFLICSLIFVICSLIN
jgi:hypothetical protein